jgi:hypothetical protein
MAASIVLTIRLGPMVSFRIEGDNCGEILEALEGFGPLNQRIDEMCSDLGERMYPESVESAPTSAGEDVVQQ